MLMLRESFKYKIKSEDFLNILPPHPALPCSLQQPTQKSAKPALVCWSKIAKKKKRASNAIDW